MTALLPGGWSWQVKVVLVAAFALAMGFMEAMVVVYLRRLLGVLPLSAPLDPYLVRDGPGWLLINEQTREAATLVMLATFALLAGHTLRTRVGVFLAAFGIWDLGYYLWLNLLIGWPSGLGDRDVLFLIPAPWIAPVWVPMLLAAAMTAVGLWLMRAEERMAEVEA